MSQLGRRNTTLRSVCRGLGTLLALEHVSSVAPVTRVLVVEDNEDLRFGMVNALTYAGHQTFEQWSCDGLLASVARDRPDVVVTDLRLPDGESIDLLPSLRAMDPVLPIIMVTGFGSIDVAVRAVKQGASDFLTKPLDMDRLIALVGAACPRVRRAAAAATNALDASVEKFRDADCPVLILGETGTGKTVLARRLHDASKRAERPFVAVNCAGLTPEFVESELFGHTRGAFTGAHLDRVGLFEAANGGTLFLDEIGDVDLMVQPKILKAVEERRFRRMGETRERASDVRLVAATNRDLLGASKQKQFRSDLYYRISTVTLKIAPLRERRDEIAGLARQMMGPNTTLSSAALARLLGHDWPGNLRELRNVLERARLSAPDAVIGPDEIVLDEVEIPDVAAGDAPKRPASSARIARAEFERAHINAALIAEAGCVGAAAKRLGMPRSTLYQRIKQYGLTLPRSRAG